MRKPLTSEGVPHVVKPGNPSAAVHAQVERLKSADWVGEVHNLMADALEAEYRRGVNDCVDRLERLAKESASPLVAEAYQMSASSLLKGKSQ